MKTDIKNQYHTCPLCLGKGKIKGHLYSPEVRKKARKLYAKGISLREIGKEIGIDHPQKVYSIIMAKTL